eukprot:TRINITY_DN34131_c0_g1_i1.p1 TRINITY_DN34131_c0_g1~~TRINITY_DN34131_c0_g1_i1.p1  ORF type:complete len:448 (+),score=41.89 TRINITY_DN34131_c0_g1_i1:66-1346(+)
MSTHTEWVDRMSQWLGPHLGSGSGSGGLAESMEKLQRRIDEGTAELQTCRVTEGPAGALPAAMKEELLGLMDQLKEDLSQELVKKLMQISKADAGKETADGLAEEAFAEVEEERKKINELEEALLFGKPLPKKKRKKPSSKKPLHDQQVLLPILDEIEQAILSTPEPCSLAPPPPPSLPRQNTFPTPLHVSQIPPPPARPYEQHVAYPAQARSITRSIEQRKSAFNSNMERDDSRSSSLSSCGMGFGPGGHSHQPNPYPHPYPNSRPANAPYASSLTSTSASSRSGSSLGTYRRPIKDPRTHMEASQGPCPVGPCGGNRLNDVPPPAPPRPSFRPPTGSRSGSGGGYSVDYSMPPPPPPGPPPRLPYAPLDDDGEDAHYKQFIAANLRRQHGYRPQASGYHRPPAGHGDDYYGSNWEVEETELTIY